MNAPLNRFSAKKTYRKATGKIAEVVPRMPDAADAVTAIDGEWLTELLSSAPLLSMQKLILLACTTYPDDLTTPELMGVLNDHRRTIQRNIGWMVDKGILERTRKSTGQGSAATYRLSPARLRSIKPEPVLPWPPYERASHPSLLRGKA